MSSVAVRLFKFEREYTPKRDMYAQGHDRYHIAGNLGSEIETLPVGEYYCSNHRQKYSRAPVTTETSDRGQNNVVRARGSTPPGPGHSR
jgi:hypothetical protein